NLIADVNIADNASATLNDAAGLGNEGVATLIGGNSNLNLDDAGTSDLAKTIAGAGNVNISGATSDVTITGTANDDFAGTWNIAADAALTATASAATTTPENVLGTADIANNGTFTVDISLTDWQLDNAMSGAGDFIKDGTATLTFAQANAMTGDTLVNDGVLHLLDAGGVGSGDITIADATLHLDFSNANYANTTFSATTGSGTALVSGQNVNIVGQNTGFSGLWQITGSAGLDTTQASTQTNLGDGAVFLDGVNSLLTIAPDAAVTAFQFESALTGNGTVDVAMKATDSTFDFTNDAINNVSPFTGTLDMGMGTFTLDGVNTDVLNDATLKASLDSTVIVGAGVQDIGGLVFDGGTVIFDATAPAQTVATSSIYTDQLDITGGAVQINLPDPYGLSLPMATLPNDASLFAQSHVITGLQLVASDNPVTGSAGNLTLQDQNGDDITTAQKDINISQGGNLVAVGTYSYLLDTGVDNDGLYVGYGLFELDLQNGQTLTLTEDAGAIDNDRDMAAMLTGTGNLNIAARDTIVLSNPINSFTGTTTVSSGTLQAGVDNIIASSSAVTVVAGATFDTNALNQSVNKLTGGGNVLLADGNMLTLHADPAGSQFDGVISGDGLVFLEDGRQILTGNNTYSGGTLIEADATLQLGNGGASGSIVGNVLSNGVLAFNRSDVYTFAGQIDGVFGAVEQNGTGTTVLTAANTYRGTTTVNSGTLRAGAQNTFSAFSVVTVAPNATLDLDGFNQTVAGLNNAGTVHFSPELGTQTILTVNGDYVGNNGRLEMNTALAADDSLTDRLVIDGGTASGTTTIAITNAGGLGAQTTGNGILLVEALNGATTTAQTTKDAFTLEGDSIKAGAFVYRLHPGDLAGAGENWFLRSKIEDTGIDEYRPEVSVVTALPGLARQSSLDLLANLHKRMGDDVKDYTDGFQYSGRVWGRVFANDIKQSSNDSVATPTASGNSYGAQLGLDLMESVNEDGRTDVGVYVGWSRSEADINGLLGQEQEISRTGKLSPKTRSIGAYWTHKKPEGFYSDVVVQGNWYDGDGVSIDNERVKIGGKGVLISLEGGYSYRLNDNWSLEPQVQLIGQGGHFDDMAITNATVSFNDPWQWTGRIGVRLVDTIRFDNGGMLKPYLRANIWHGFDATQTVTFSTPAASTPVDVGLGYTSGELGGGLTWAVTDKMRVYGEVSQVFSMDNNAQSVRKGTTGTIGVKWDW
ncbi:MAG: autotransporter outer membrane beta-barrel domain-containing protein, partial [Gallionellaceae bacterium]|nr:autotransporter outer membrane beta-barrel domain-containing protein [Gallionellaceae bacterium]